MPGSSASSWLYGENKVQAPVTNNVKVNPELPRIRQAVLKNNKLDKKTVFGNGPLSLPGGTPNSLLAIRRYRPVFHHKNTSRATGYEGYHESTPSVFQVLNGLAVDRKFISADGKLTSGFRRQFICAGFSMTDYEFDIPEQTPSGVAALCDGALDTFNNSKLAWFPGDRLTFDAPDIDGSYNADAVPIYGESTDRIEFIIKPVTAIEASQWYEYELARFFSNSAGENDYSVDMLVNRVEDNDIENERRAVAQFVSMIKVVALATIATLQANNVTADQSLIAFADDGSIDAGSVARYDGLLNTLNNNLAIAPVPVANLRNTGNNLSAWMHLLGLVPSAAAAGTPLREAKEFVAQLVALTCRGVPALPGVQQTFSFERFLPEGKANGIYDAPSFGSSRGDLNVNNKYGALVYLNRAAVRGTIQGFKDSVLEQLNSYVATCMEFTPPRTKGNVRV
jgi:hypothetical protein